VDIQKKKKNKGKELDVQNYFLGLEVHVHIMVFQSFIAGGT
jgi:hypothetical protein